MTLTTSKLMVSLLQLCLLMWVWHTYIDGISLWKFLSWLLFLSDSVTRMNPLNSPLCCNKDILHYSSFRPVLPWSQLYRDLAGLDQTHLSKEQVKKKKKLEYEVISQHVNPLKCYEPVFLQWKAVLISLSQRDNLLWPQHPHSVLSHWHQSLLFSTEVLRGGTAPSAFILS